MSKNRLISIGSTVAWSQGSLLTLRLKNWSGSEGPILTFHLADLHRALVEELDVTFCFHFLPLHHSGYFTSPVSPRSAFVFVSEWWA